MSGRLSISINYHGIKPGVENLFAKFQMDLINMFHISQTQDASFHQTGSIEEHRQITQQRISEQQLHSLSVIQVFMLKL